ncbi:MAG TPA: hypothetical protein VNP37_12375 [Actinomycetospora sp.]|nr:hypothetical protein [Actinomycetospora sp.]
MSEQRSNEADAADIQQRYVAEHDEDQALVEGLDPAQPREQKTTDQVAAVGDHADEDVEEMADPER